MVEEMETIVASVSGYHGSQRLKLVRLIAAVGANYVGKLSKSTTHLVCWKFKGEKYDLANKLGTIVVNHRWLEDCMKERKRVPEDPYTLISGEDVGPIMSELSAVTEQVHPLKEIKLISNQRSMHDSVREVIDLDSDEIENDDFYDELLLDENLIPKPGRKTTARQKSKRKVVKDTSKGDRRAKTDNKTLSYEIESEESEPDLSNKQRRRNTDITTATDFAESSRRSRRLVKKNAKSGTSVLATNGTGLRGRTLANRNFGPSFSSLSSDSRELREETEASIGNRHGTSSFAHGECEHQRDSLNDINLLGDAVNIPDADGMNLHEISSTHQNSNEQHQNKDLDHNLAGLQKHVELSCVICFTEFCSTRGILPCGHRFCFSCIQQWADRLASSRKETTCPLCKASFASITRVDAAAFLDQKIYSQTVPCASSSQDIFIVPEAEAVRSNSQVALQAVCCRCQSRDPADLLLNCEICQTSLIHSYCLDPPLFPWTCSGCRDRRLFYR